jgi:flagellar protein FliS
MTPNRLAAAQATLARSRATQQYQQTQTLTVTQGQLVVMLYEGVLRFCQAARQAVQEGQIEPTHQALCRAQDIINELDATLNLDAGTVAINLHRLYRYCVRRLIEANVNKDPTPIDEVLLHFTTLLEAWRQAVAVHDQTGQAGNAEGVQVTPQP